MNETVSQILSDFRFTEVWQWLRPEATCDFPVIGPYEEAGIFLHHDVVGRGVIVNDVQHHFEVQLVCLCYKIVQVLIASCFGINGVVIGDAVRRGIWVRRSLSNRA